MSAEMFIPLSGRQSRAPLTLHRADLFQNLFAPNFLLLNSTRFSLPTRNLDPHPSGLPPWVAFPQLSDREISGSSSR